MFLRVLVFIYFILFSSSVFSKDIPIIVITAGKTQQSKGTVGSDVEVVDTPGLTDDGGTVRTRKKGGGGGKTKTGGGGRDIKGNPATMSHVLSSSEGGGGGYKLGLHVVDGSRVCRMSKMGGRSEGNASECDRKVFDPFYLPSFCWKLLDTGF